MSYPDYTFSHIVYDLCINWERERERERERYRERETEIQRERQREKESERQREKERERERERETRGLHCHLSLLTDVLSLTNWPSSKNVGCFSIRILPCSTLSCSECILRGRSCEDESVENT